MAASRVSSCVCQPTLLVPSSLLIRAKIANRCWQPDNPGMIDLRYEKPVTVAEVAKLFGVHRRTVEKWFGQGLERIKVGGRVFTTLEALNRFAVPEDGSEKLPSNRRATKEYIDAEIRLGLLFLGDRKASWKPGGYYERRYLDGIRKLEERFGKERVIGYVRQAEYKAAIRELKQKAVDKHLGSSDGH